MLGFVDRFIFAPAEKILGFVNWFFEADSTTVNYDCPNPGIEYSSGTLNIKHNHLSLTQLINELNGEAGAYTGTDLDTYHNRLNALEKQTNICLTTHTKLLMAYDDDKSQKGRQMRGNLPGAVKEDEYILEEINKGKYRFR